MIGTGSIAPCKQNVSTTLWQDAAPADMMDIDIPTALGVHLHEFRWDGRNSFSRFSGRSGVTLPIELLSFSAKYNGQNAVNIKWSTASERNNDYFNVERSADSIQFIPINKIVAGGNLTQFTNYSAVDRSPLQGLSYYRLKQTDYDGKFTYSDIVSVRINEKTDQLSFDAYPNPSSGEDLKILLRAAKGENVVISIYDINGKVCFNTAILIADWREHIYDLDPLMKLNPGVYFISATTAQSTIRKKLVVK